MKKQMHNSQLIKNAMALTAVMLSAAVFTACGGSKTEETTAVSETAATEAAAETTAVETSAEETKAEESKETQSKTDAVHTKASVSFKPVMPADGSPITFIGEPFYDGTVEDEEDAEAAVKSVIEYLGGNENTSLELVDVIDNVEGNVYYTFRQLEGDIAVYGSAVKLITDKDGQAIALSSSLTPGIDAANIKEWGVTMEEAEQVILNSYEGEDVEIVKDATETTLLPFEDDSTEFYTAWVVYTNNIYPEYDTAFLAHYVDADGEYLFALPVSEPGNADSHSGEGALLAFSGFTEGSWTGTVTGYDGQQKEITVPLLVDPETGEEYLGDLERKVMVADCATFENEEDIVLRTKDTWGDNELLIYETFLRIWDVYDSCGWPGPDGEGSPSLLLMDWVDENGDPVPNACYAGRQHGFQTFMFNRNDPDGENTDIMAHEFTHCVTGTLWTDSMYFNEYGAINEALSDICGNTIESFLGDTEDTQWIIGEHGEPLRSMSNPNEYDQPAFAWDTYYVPQAVRSTSNNDNGGVHINSSLLNLIAYRLHEAGFKDDDFLYYWINVSMGMTPKTDFSQITEILTWTLEKIGCGEYRDVLDKAIEEVSLKDLSLPDKAPEGLGRIEFNLPYADLFEEYNVTASFLNMDTGIVYTTWPIAGSDVIASTVPAGQYISFIIFEDEAEENAVAAIQTDHGWEFMNIEQIYALEDIIDELYFCSVDEGEIAQLETDTLKAIMEEE